MISVCDDFLPVSDFKTIQESCINLTWDYHPTLTGMEAGYNAYQFVHLFYTVGDVHHHSPCLPYLDPILKQLEPLYVFRLKANLRPYTPKIVGSEYHVDIEIPCKTAIYYFNTNDGYTYFEDGTKVESIANRLLVFDSHLRHAGTTCTNDKARVVLNMNYTPSSKPLPFARVIKF